MKKTVLTYLSIYLSETKKQTLVSSSARDRVFVSEGAGDAGGAAQAPVVLADLHPRALQLRRVRPECKLSS